MDIDNLGDGKGGGTIFPHFYLSPSLHPSLCPPLCTHDTPSVFLSTSHLALSRTGLTVKNTKDQLCVGVCVLNIWSGVCFQHFYIYFYSIFIYTTASPHVCHLMYLCVFLQRLCSRSNPIHFTIALPSLVFIYLSIPSFSTLAASSSSRSVHKLTIRQPL